MVINGHVVQFLSAANPEEIDYEAHGIKDALLIDNTGKLRDREGLGRHLKAKGVQRVLLTAPGKGDIPNIVYGVNQETCNLNPAEERLFSAASCTTNAIVPVLNVDRNRARHRPRPCRDDPLLHQRPEPPGQLPQEDAPRPFGPPEHGHHRDRRRLGGREGDSQPEGQADGQCRPGADPQCVAGDPVAATSPAM